MSVSGAPSACQAPRLCSWGPAPSGRILARWRDPAPPPGAGSALRRRGAGGARAERAGGGTGRPLGGVAAGEEGGHSAVGVESGPRHPPQVHPRSPTMRVLQPQNRPSFRRESLLFPTTRCRTPDGSERGPRAAQAEAGRGSGCTLGVAISCTRSKGLGCCWWLPTPRMHPRAGQTRANRANRVNAT